jgi:hypothetical protein
MLRTGSGLDPNGAFGGFSGAPQGMQQGPFTAGALLISDTRAQDSRVVRSNVGESSHTQRRV